MQPLAPSLAGASPPPSSSAAGVSSGGYRTEIDGLRAIAVLLVLVFHFEVFDIGHAGFMGVDIFFVISGYLITSMIVRQMDAGSFSFSTFYANRVRRLAPALIAVVALTVLYGAKALFPDPFIELLRQATLAQLYVVNVYYWRTIGYFGLSAQDVHLLHLWSLCVEEQFYILFPAAVYVVAKFARRHLWWCIGIAFVVSFGLNLYFVQTKPEAAFYLLPTRAWELLAGALVAGTNWQRELPSRLRSLLMLGGFSFIVLALVWYQRDIRFPGAFALLPVAGASLIVLAVARSGVALSPLLSNRAMAYIGRISYPLYLVHWPVHVFARQAWGQEDYSVGLRWSMLALSLVLASLIYHWVENPVRGRRWLPRTRPLLAAYVASLSIVVLMFAWVQAEDGMPQRFPAAVQRMANFVNDKSPPTKECEFHGAAMQTDSATCRVGDPKAPVTWLVFGDSHALAAQAVFDEWLKRRGAAGLLFYRNSCPPTLGLHAFGDRGLCLHFNREMVRILQSHAAIERVFLVSTWLQPWHGRLSPVEHQLLDRAASIDAFDRGFSELLQELARQGKRVYIWEPVPGARDHVPLATARAMLQGRTIDLSLPRDEYDRVYDYFFAALKKNDAFIEATFSPAAAICDARSCAAMIGDVPAYADNSHISRSPAAFWVDAMERTKALSR